MGNLIYNQQDMDNGLVLVDSDFGKDIGLTSDKFYDGSYLWYRKEENTLWLSMLMSKEEHRGYVLNILRVAHNREYNMKAVPVSRRMFTILDRFGFKFDASDGSMIYRNNNIKTK